MWNLTTEPDLRLTKICNECKNMIEAFDENHPMTIAVFQNLTNDKPLEFGLEPYHWHKPDKAHPNCLVPTIYKTDLTPLFDEPKRPEPEPPKKQVEDKLPMFANKRYNIGKRGRPQVVTKAALEKTTDELLQEIEKINAKPE